MKYLSQIHFVITGIALLVSLSVGGCAISALVTERGLFIAREDKLPDFDHRTFPLATIADVQLAFSCGDLVHAVSVSPVVPLPPIVPVRSKVQNLHTNVSLSIIATNEKLAAFSLDDIVIVKRTGEKVSQIDINDKGGYVFDPDSDKQVKGIEITFAAETCQELDGARLEIGQLQVGKDKVVVPDFRLYYREVKKIKADYLRS